MTIGILSKLRLFLSQNALLKLYYALIHSQVPHGLVIRGSTFPSYLNKLQSLQNKAVKMIEGCSSPDNLTKFFNKFSILKLNDLFKLEVAKIVHAHFNGNLPPQLSKLLTLTKTSPLEPLEQLNLQAISYISAIQPGILYAEVYAKSKSGYTTQNWYTKGIPSHHAL